MSKKIANLGTENTRLRNEEQERLGLAADAPTIMGILEHHKRLFPGTKIIRGKAAWKAVKARLAEIEAGPEGPAFTPLDLKAAAVGLKLSRTGARADRPHGAAWLYDDAERVQYFRGVCVTFKREVGTSALAIVDQLGTPALAWLADPCSCGQLRATHLMGWTDCVFDELHAKVERWAAERERGAVA